MKRLWNRVLLLQHKINRVQYSSFHTSLIIYREKIQLDLEPLVKLPPKPEPPEPELCCMSGCAVCVLDVYQDDLRAYEELKKQLIYQLKEQGLPLPSELKEEEEDIDPSMKAFMMFEKNLKDKK